MGHYFKAITNRIRGTAMPFYEKGNVRIHYEESGSGFPLLIIPGGATPTTANRLARSKWIGLGTATPTTKSA